MKILQLQTELNLACGVTRTISEIINNSSLEFEHHLISFGGNGIVRFSFEKVKIKIINQNRNSFWGTLLAAIKIASYIKHHDIEIVHSHHRYFDTLVWMIKPLLKIKTITSVHSKVYNHKLFSYKSDILIACGNSVKAHLINDFKIDESRIKVIYNSIDSKEVVLTKTKTELVNLLDIPSNKFILGYFGRLDFKEKGIDILLEAFLNLSKVNKDLFLLIIGNGVDENKIREFIAQYKLRAKVMNSQRDIFNYYQLIDVFVLPSRIDPFPLVMLEAGFIKIPLIGSNVDGIAELIKNEIDGLLFEPGNSDDLQNKILKIYYDKNFADKLTENLYSKVLDSYTVQSIIPQYEKLYLSLHDEK